MFMEFKTCQILIINPGEDLFQLDGLTMQVIYGSLQEIVIVHFPTILMIFGDIISQRILGHG